MGACSLSLPDHCRRLPPPLVPHLGPGRGPPEAAHRGARSAGLSGLGLGPGLAPLGVSHVRRRGLAPVPCLQLPFEPALQICRRLASAHLHRLGLCLHLSLCPAPTRHLQAPLLVGSTADMLPRCLTPKPVLSLC